MALQHQTTQRGPAKEHFGYACEFQAQEHASHTHSDAHPVHVIIIDLAFHLITQDPQMLDQLAKNITRCGLSNSTLNYLRVSTSYI